MNRAGGEMRLAVIIPTLNEEAAIAQALESLLAQKNDLDLVIVADGGSTDGTLAVAQQHGATIVAVGKPGRGGQVAAALRELDHEVILIVHADMIVPSGALALVRQSLVEKPECPGGCLGHRFDGARRMLRWTEWWDERRARRGMSYGDQAQFFRRELLAAHGGFPDQPIMEDVELSRRLKRLGRPIYLDCPVVVSARRYARLGWLRTTLANFLIRLAYRLCGLRACQAIYRHYYGRR
ncbi:MAG: TIGR04283 family arsenosugar biosynthesis glycosyltransferase [Pirellulales bacterium]